MRKLTIQQVREGFESKGWKLLSSDYQGSQKKLDVICPHNNQVTITWNNFQRGQGCACEVRNVKYTLEEVRVFFVQHGCELLDEFYVNNNKPVKYRCECGKESKIALAHLLNGGRCQECKKRKLSLAFRETDENIKNFCRQHECEFISSSIKKGKTYINYICKCKKEAEAYYTNFQRYPNCWECGKIKKSGERCYRWNPNREHIKLLKKSRKLCDRMIRRCLKKTGGKKITNTIALLGYTPEQLGNHLKNHPNMAQLKSVKIEVDHVFPLKAFIDYNITDLKIINCLENLQPLEKNSNLFKAANYNIQAFENWLSTNKIPYISKLQDWQQQAKNILDWIKSLGLDASFDERNNIKCGNIAVLYKDVRIASKMDAYKSKKEYENIGLRPVIVFSDEWGFKKEQCKNFIKSIFGIYEEKVHARKCELKTITTLQGREFFQKNHIQGSNRSGIVFWGLFCKNDMVAALSLGRHTRQGHEDVVVLDRFCVKNGLHIPGGASKLFTAAKKWAQEKYYKTIVSFSDNRWSRGNIYMILGFKKFKEYRPDYSYVGVNGIRVSKQSQKKSASNCPENMTEKQWAAARGLEPVWDCGKIRWDYKP